MVTMLQTRKQNQISSHKKHRGNLEIQVPRSKDRIPPPRLRALPLLTSQFMACSYPSCVSHLKFLVIFIVTLSFSLYTDFPGLLWEI